jgi:hypothetical protein
MIRFTIFSRIRHFARFHFVCEPHGTGCILLGLQANHTLTAKRAKTSQLFGYFPDGDKSMGRRILNRKDLRADFEAAERRKTDEEEVDEEEEGDEEDDEEEEEDGEAAEPSDESEDPDLDEMVDEEELPKKKKKAVKEPKLKAKPKSRSRAAKVVRMKVVWGVFNNSNQRVAVYDYPKRKEADDHAAKLTADKKSTHFVQPLKEPMEEKKET